MQEITQLKQVLASDMKERDILADRLKQPPGRFFGVPGATAVLEGSQILICSSSDIETHIIGQAFSKLLRSTIFISKSKLSRKVAVLSYVNCNFQDLLLLPNYLWFSLIKHIRCC